MTDTRPQSFPPPAPSSLQDFEPLLLAELIVLRAAASGKIAKVGYRRPRAATPDVSLRAAFLGFLACGGDGDTPIAGRQLQIMGACVVGRLDLAAANVPMSLWFYRCAFNAAPLLASAHVFGSLSFADCALPGLRAEACRVDGDLALNAGCSVAGVIELARARVGRDLDCERLHLRGDDAAAGVLRRMFVADAIRVGGDVNWSGGVDSVGELRFVGARIGGNLRAGNAHLTADIDAAGMRGVALNLDRARVGGSIHLDAGFSAAGTVRLVRARIGGDLDCRGAAFDTVGDASWGACGSALRLDRARIAGALVLQQLQEPLQAASLADARVGTLADDAGTWGQQHVLDGFTYTRFGAEAPTDAPTRLAWLARQATAHLDLDYRPDPWRRAIRVLRRSGRAAEAAALAIGRERHLRRIGRIGRAAPAPLRGLARLVHGAWGLFAGYGHRPLRLLATAVVVWLLCSGAYWAAAERGGFVPAAMASRAPGGVPAFQPALYSLDALVPLADLRQQREWAPAHGASAELAMLPWLIGLEAACGWALIAMAVASVFGLADRDRRLSSA